MSDLLIGYLAGVHDAAAAHAAWRRQLIDEMEKTIDIKRAVYEQANYKYRHMDAAKRAEIRGLEEALDIVEGHE